MKTNLTVGMMYITPEIAENYLKFNLKNRGIAQNHLTFLTNEMNGDRYIENGESIVFDYNETLLDGQHRLISITRSEKSYWIPVVRGVAPEAISTYDTGKNRRASDVLTINGFQYAGAIASAIKIINKFAINKSQAKMSGSGSRRLTLSNQQVLEYCQDNYHWLLPLISSAYSILEKQKPMVLSISQMTIILYLLGGETPSTQHYNFIKHLCGVSREHGTPANYVYTKIYNSKINKEPLNFHWVLGMTIRAWNFYIDGNPSVKRFYFNIENPLPKISRI